MGDCRSKEDDLQKISISIFVTSFPEQTNAKELWGICKQYGNVIDAFIPNRRSKIGKRFGLVGFIKVSDVDRLVNNLCMIWIGSFKLHANVARFKRLPLNKGSQHDDTTVKVRIPSVETINRGGAHGISNSYIQAFKIDIKGFPLCIWSRNTFDKKISKWGSLLHEEEEDDSYFHRKRLCIKTAIADYIFESFKILVNGKIFWVRAKEVTGWALKFFDTQDVFFDSDVGLVNVNGDALSENGKDDLHSEVEEIPETVFEEGEIKSTDIKEKSNEVQQEAQSDDPFNIYGLLKTKHLVSNATCQSEEEPKYPPGFTPRDNSVIFYRASSGADIHQKESSEKENGSNTCFKEDVNASAFLGHFKKLKKDSALFLMRASAFNSFITSGGLVEVPSGGYSFTLSHKSAAKMSKLDRILVSDDIISAKMVKDFRPISLIGSLYKIISKLLANRLVTVMSDLVNEVQSAFFANRGSILVNGKPTLEFQFYKGLKQGDPLSLFLFIIVMESLHMSFHNVVSASLFKGAALDTSLQLSHLFYADGMVFVGQWCGSNLSTVIRVLDCFVQASGLRINLFKSKLIGGNMLRIKAWDNVINKVLCQLSKWKMKSLSLEDSIRNHFFNVVDSNVQKMMLVKWDNVLASKEKGGLGVLSFYTFNHALTFKWIWQFPTHDSSLWSRVIKSIHGEDGKIGNSFKSGIVSNWNNITRGVTLLHNKVVNKMAHSSLVSSLRRNPKGGDEEFLVASVRNLIDDRTPGVVYVEPNIECPPISYRICGNTFEFGRQEFCLINGFLFGKLPKEESYEGILNSKFLDCIFPDRSSKRLNTVKGGDLMELFTNDDLLFGISDHDAIRVCLLLVATIVFMGRNRRTFNVLQWKNERESKKDKDKSVEPPKKKIKVGKVSKMKNKSLEASQEKMTSITFRVCMGCQEQKDLICRFGDNDSNIQPVDYDEPQNSNNGAKENALCEFDAIRPDDYDELDNSYIMDIEEVLETKLDETIVDCSTVQATPHLNAIEEQEYHPTDKVGVQELHPPPKPASLIDNLKASFGSDDTLGPVGQDHINFDTAWRSAYNSNGCHFFKINRYWEAGLVQGNGD
nr:RNA-directed DNA polymerase, eukaryota [Tanacetum cinerariifolium]